MFLPSGTMCNQIALLTHCRPGDEVLAHETAHILTAEGGGAAALAGVQIIAAGRRARAVRRGDAGGGAAAARRRYAPSQTLLEVEQTANLGGGSVWPTGGAERGGGLRRMRTAWRRTWTARG